MIQRSLPIFVLAALSSTSSAAFDLSFSVTNDRRVDNTLVGFTSVDGQHEGADLIGGFAPGTYDYTVSVPGLREQYASYRYSLIATYASPEGREGLVIALRPEIAARSVGRPFAEVFSGQSEASVVGAVKGAASGDFFAAFRLRQFFLNSVDLMPLGESGGSLVGFSKGQIVGSIRPVPEPSALAVLGFAAVAFVRRRKASSK